jgi:hypothetical protein
MLGSDFLNMTSNVILDLVSIPKHRTVLGVNCETYTSSLPSMFKDGLMDMAVFVVKFAHLTVEKVYCAPPFLVSSFGARQPIVTRYWTGDDLRARIRSAGTHKW